MTDGLLRRKIGQFYLVQHIGSGGMSEVYLALNPKTREKRAVKILKRRATAPAGAYPRFLREVEIIRRLAHPRIVRVLESGTLEDCYFYAMEYMPGGSLARRIAHGPIAFAESVTLLAGICDGVAYAHQRGIVHRDLKPANVLIGASGEPSIADFGIAKSLLEEGTALTRSNEIMGTIAYLAPEQRCSTKRVDRRADVYALGAVFYEMLTGFPPLGNFPWPHETRSGIPAGLKPLLEKCLATDPRARFHDASELLVEVRRLADDSCRQAEVRSEVAQDVAEWTPDSDRVERWLNLLRSGTTRERLAVVREMVDQITPGEASALLKVYVGEQDKVRWGLIRVFGELRLLPASRIIMGELRSPYHRECAVEALGKIGAEEAFEPILAFLSQSPDAAMTALPAVASTGRERAIPYLRPYLAHPVSVLRLKAAQALASLQSTDALDLLRKQLAKERDDRVRGVLVQAVRDLETSRRGGSDTILLESAH